MRNLNNAELSKISGGDLCDDGMCIKISTTGIPAQHYQVINSNMQSMINGTLSPEQAISNIINAGSDMYLDTYFYNLENSNTIYFV